MDLFKTFSKPKSAWFNLIFIFSLFSPPLFAGKNISLSRPEDSQQLQAHSHPAFGNLAPYYKDILLAYQRHGTFRIEKAQNFGFNAITVVTQQPRDTSTILAVLKREVEPELGRRETMIYGLSRQANLSSIVPTFDFRGQAALEIFVPFMPKNVAPNAVMQEFYRTFKNPFGSVILLDIYRKIKDVHVKEKYKWLTFIEENADPQSLQEVAIAHLLFGLGDLEDRNLALRLTPEGTIAFYIFDTEDSMRRYPRSNCILSLALSHPISSQTRDIVQTWDGTLFHNPDLQKSVDRLWASSDLLSKRGIVLSSYTFFRERGLPIRDFILSNPGVSVGDLCLYAFLGAPNDYRRIHAPSEFLNDFAPYIGKSLPTDGKLNLFFYPKDPENAEFCLELDLIFRKVSQLLNSKRHLQVRGLPPPLRHKKEDAALRTLLNNRPLMLQTFMRRLSNTTLGQTVRGKVKRYFGQTLPIQLPRGFELAHFIRLNGGLKGRFRKEKKIGVHRSFTRQELSNYHKWLRALVLSSGEPRRAWNPKLPTGFELEHFKRLNPDLEGRYRHERGVPSDRGLNTTENVEFHNWLQAVMLAPHEQRRAWKAELPTGFSLTQFKGANPHLERRFRKEQRISSDSQFSAEQNMKYHNWLQAIMIIEGPGRYKLEKGSE